jgi:formamidopyrimidine-DNA glycosylase
VPLNFSAGHKSDGLFYYGRAPGAPDFYSERLRVYDRAESPVFHCGSPDPPHRAGGAQHFFCPRCQKS